MSFFSVVCMWSADYSCFCKNNNIFGKLSEFSGFLFGNRAFFFRFQPFCPILCHDFFRQTCLQALSRVTFCIEKGHLLYVERSPFT